MNKFSRSLFTTITIYTVLFGLLCMVSPLEVERSKWISFQEWLEADQSNTENQETTQIDIHSFESWTDFHNSQTAAHVVVKADQQQKLVTSGISVKSASTAEDYVVFQQTAVCAASLNQLVEPLISGIAIGAP